MCKRSVFVLLSVFLCFGLLGACAPQQSQTDAPTLPREDLIEYEGRIYEQREDLTTLLVMGIDKYERPEEDPGYTNDMQADFLMLLVIDEEAEQCRVLHINRDTMTEIRRLGVGGEGAGRFRGQIALAHTYGSGGSDSCLNAVRAVSELLGDVDIDHYATLTMDAVGTVNDLAGGVKVTLLDDFTAVDPAMKKGEGLTLKGEQALVYVRGRMGVGDSSNLGRMERQRQYLTALYGQMMDLQREDDDFLGDTLLQLNDAFMSDCTVGQLDELADILTECDIQPIEDLAGRAVVGEKYMEFHADEDALMEKVLSLFYKEIH